MKRGNVKVVPDTPDDLWHLYNIIFENDKVFAYTTREINIEEKFARPKKGKRISAFVGVNVRKVGWDKSLGRLRVNGIICSAPENIPLGVHHTLKVTLNKPITILKETWSKIHLDRLNRASKQIEKPIIIVSIDDECYVIGTTTQYGIKIKFEGRVKLPGKREQEKRGKETIEYFNKVISSLRQVWSENQSPIVIIGVGFIKTHFFKHVNSVQPNIGKSVVEVKSVNNNGVSGIHEALRSGVLIKTIKNLQVTRETEIMEEILKRLGKNDFRITYGYDNVVKAIEAGGVETLVLADSMLRESSEEVRRNIERIIVQAEQTGGEIRIISTEYETGKSLVSFGGIAALLRFSMYFDQKGKTELS